MTAKTEAPNATKLASFLRKHGFHQFRARHHGDTCRIEIDPADMAKFAEVAKEAVERTVKDLQELRRQAASSIVVPQGKAPRRQLPLA